MHTNDKTRIVRNTAFLYVRMAVLMIVGLITSRLTLQQLGITDFGIYNVIGGLISIFSFISGSMTQASQRFITYELGRGNEGSLRNVFSTCVFLHVILALIIVVLGETVGLWYVWNVAVIPPERFTAALWIYQCSIVVACADIITVPYNGLIVAHERMSAFAYLTIIEGVLKLVIVLLLIFAPFDKLTIYGIMMATLAVFMRIIYGMYAKRHFPESRLLWRVDRECVRSMGGYAGWSMIGSMAAAGYTQGLNMLLNAFFNPVVNAARGVAVTVQSVIRTFSTNFQMAVNPQITKSYAAGESDYMHDIVISMSKYTFFLYFLFAMPVFLEIDELLDIWLVEVPDYSASFIRILLIISVFEVMASPLNTSIQATGRVRIFELTTGIIMLLTVPVAWIGLKIWHNPNIAFYAFLSQTVIAFGVRLWLAYRMTGLSALRYLRYVTGKVLCIAAAASVVPVFLHLGMSQGLLRLFVVGGSAMITTPAVMYAVGLSHSERATVNGKISHLLHRKG